MDEGSLAKKIEELEGRYRSDIIGEWTNDYGGWSPGSEDLSIRADGQGSVTGLDGMAFKWAPNGDFSMKVWDIVSTDSEDASADPTEHVVTWRFERSVMHDGETIVELKLSPFGLLVTSGLV